MKKTILLVAMGASFGVLPAQPVISSVVNDASLGPRGMKHWAVAPGSIIRIRGERMGPENQVNAEGFPLLTELGGVSVELESFAGRVPALLLSASAYEIKAIVPSAFPADVSAGVTVRVGGRTSPSFLLGTQQNNFGIYTANGVGTGPAAADNIISEDGQDLKTEANSLLKPARPGQAVVLSGTGLGPVSGDESSNTQPGALDVPLKIFIGNSEAVIRYQGRAECCPGRDRVVIVVPAGVAGCYVPVVGRIRDVLGNFATLSISPDGSPCTDPTGLTAEELIKISANEGANIGAISLRRFVDEIVRNPGASETATATFSHYDVGGLLQSYGIFGLPATGTCLAYAEQRAPFIPIDPTVPPRLDAGPALTLSGPKGTKRLPRDANGGYSATLNRALESDPNLYLSPGNYTIDNGSGGADVGAFRAEFSIPERVLWTNRAGAAATSRTSLVSVDWVGGDTDSFVVMSGRIENRAVGLNFVCAEKASAGTFNQPRHMDEFAPIEGGVFGGLPDILSLVTVSKPVRFSAPGLDFGLIQSAIGEGFFTP